jgi:hypothetical protein
MADRSAAAKKAAQARKHRAAGKKAATTRKLRAAGKKVELTRKRREPGREAEATRKLKKEQKASAPRYTLIPELVPSPLFHKSVHDLFNNDRRWKRIRDATCAKADNQCSACATRENPHCNEVWTYSDDGNVGVAELTAFEICAAIATVLTT